MIRSRSDCCCPMTKSEKDDEHVFLKKKNHLHFIMSA